MRTRSAVWFLLLGFSRLLKSILSLLRRRLTIQENRSTCSKSVVWLVRLWIFCFWFLPTLTNLCRLLYNKLTRQKALMGEGGIAHLIPERNWARVCGPLSSRGHYGRDWNSIYDPIYTNFTVACDFSSNLSLLDSSYKGDIYRQVGYVAYDHEWSWVMLLQGMFCNSSGPFRGPFLNLEFQSTWIRVWTYIYVHQKMTFAGLDIASSLLELVCKCYILN